MAWRLEIISFDYLLYHLTHLFMHHLSFLRGRHGRLTYATHLALVLTPLLVILFVANTDTWWYLSLATLLTVVCTGSAALLAICRLHDLGLSGWHALLLIVPVLNLPGLLLLALVPGVATNNRWGSAATPRHLLPRFNLAGMRFALLSYLTSRWWRALLH